MADESRKCGVCGRQADYICERCLRCEQCCADRDLIRDKPEQHLGNWLWHRKSEKGVKLVALQRAGHGKGDYEGKTVEKAPARPGADKAR